jgi:hypothetical protein
VPFKFAEYFADKRHNPQPGFSKPYSPGGWPSYPTTSPVIPGPTGTGIPTPPSPSISTPVIPSISTPVIPSGTGVSPPIIPSIPTPSIPSGTGISPPVIPTGTGTYSIVPYYPTAAVDRRGLQIDYKLAPRNPDGELEARHHPRPHHHPHGTGFPHGTGKPSHFPFPTGTSGFGWPTALPTPTGH